MRITNQSHKEPVNSIGRLVNKFTVDTPSCFAVSAFPNPGQVNNIDVAIAFKNLIIKPIA